MTFEASPPPLPNPPPLFPFLPIPYPLPLQTPATQATRKQKQTSSLNYFTTKCKLYLFSQRNIFKKQPHFSLKNNTRWHEGFKLPLFMLLCKFRPILPRSQRLLLAIFVPYFFSFVFVIMASTFFHDFFQKRKKASL